MLTVNVYNWFLLHYMFLMLVHQHLHANTIVHFVWYETNNWKIYQFRVFPFLVYLKTVWRWCWTRFTLMSLKLNQMNEMLLTCDDEWKSKMNQWKTWWHSRNNEEFYSHAIRRFPIALAFFNAFTLDFMAVILWLQWLL